MARAEKWVPWQPCSFSLSDLRSFLWDFKRVLFKYWVPKEDGLKIECNLILERTASFNTTFTKKKKKENQGLTDFSVVPDSDLSHNCIILKQLVDNNQAICKVKKKKQTKTLTFSLKECLRQISVIAWLIKMCLVIQNDVIVGEIKELTHRYFKHLVLYPLLTMTMQDKVWRNTQQSSCK